MRAKRVYKRFMSGLLTILMLAGILLLPSQGQQHNANYTDVPINTWCYNAVKYVSINEIMTGTSHGVFNPQMAMTRAMFVTVIYRHSGEQSPQTNPFADVPDNAWYAEAVKWAASKGIVMGISKTLFSPNADISREQMVVMLYRYTTVNNPAIETQNNLEEYTDKNQISSFAVRAMQWAIAEGFINGTSATTLSPKKTATRAEAAAMIAAYCINTTAKALYREKNAQTLRTGSNYFYIGMADYEALTLCGNPNEKLQSEHGFTWFVYNTTDYNNYFMLGISENKVVALYAENNNFSYMGVNAKEVPKNIEINKAGPVTSEQLIDTIDGNKMYAVYLRDKMYRYEGASDGSMQQEAKLLYHLNNAYRKTHGLSLLKWDASAASAANEHSQDMKNKGYVSHTSPEGTTIVDRLNSKGIEWISCGENIVVGTLDAIEAHNRLLNSDGHRENILSSKYKYLGVGAAFIAHVYLVFYFTEDYWW